jgi:hypothetical protein
MALALAASAIAQDPATRAGNNAITAPAWTRARAVWFSQSPNPVAAELCVGAAAAPWDDAARKAVEHASAGSRVALGNDGWATLDTFTGCSCSGTKVRQGCYYLMLERGKDGWALLLLEPAAIQKSQLLPAGAAKEKALARLVLKEGTGAEAPLGFELAPDAAKGTAELRIHWGTHAWTAVLEVQGAAGNSPIAQVMERHGSRLAIAPARDGRQAFALLDHSQPSWNAGRTAAAQQIKKGGRWRLGQDWWTTLDCNAPLSLGGRKLAAGTWHLSLKKTGDDAWSLVCTPAGDDVGAQLDAFGAEQSKPVVEVALVAGATAAKAEALKIQFVAEGAAQKLTISFGDRELSTPVAAP